MKVRFPITDVGKNYIFEGYKLNETQKEILIHIENTPQITKKKSVNQLIKGFEQFKEI